MGVRNECRFDSVKVSIPFSQAQANWMIGRAMAGLDTDMDEWRVYSAFYFTTSKSQTASSSSPFS